MRRRSVILALVLLGATAALAAENEAEKGENPPETAPEEVPAKPAEEEADLLVGHWVGAWYSDARGYGDDLECIIVKLTDTKYEARFKATFWKVFTWRQRVLLTVGKGEAEWTFEGEQDLGWIAGGLYTYKGTTDGETFESTYKARSDAGSYTMKRVAAVDE